MRLAGALAILLTPVPALAQQLGDFVVSPDILLEANSNGSGYMVNGVGAPSVVWDPNVGRYIMVFEVRLPEADPACPVGKWGLGIAVSTDATTGWNTLNNPLLEPAAGTYYACVAAHPTILYDAATSSLTVWFKAEQTSPPDVAVGPSRFTGVGRMRVKFRPGGGIKNVAVDPAPALPITQNFGMPKVIQAGGQYEMMLTMVPDAWMATGAAPDAFVLDPAPIMSPDPGIWWAADELFNGALVCEDDPIFSYAAFIGGKDTGAYGTILQGGWSKAISANTDDWFLAVDPYFDWVGDEEWRHWDVLPVHDPAGTEYLVWFSEKDEAGLNRIRFASTTSAWNTADIDDRVCP